MHFRFYGLLILLRGSNENLRKIIILKILHQLFSSLKSLKHDLFIEILRYYSLNSIPLFAFYGSNLSPFPVLTVFCRECDRYRPTLYHIVPKTNHCHFCSEQARTFPYQNWNRITFLIEGHEPYRTIIGTITGLKTDKGPNFDTVQFAFAFVT